MPYLMLNGVKQEFETFGDIHNPPLILLYGGATNPSTWRVWNYNNSIDKLAEENYVIAWDRRGHGSSRIPADSTLEDLAKDLFTLMDTLCIEKASVVGMSAGTYVLGCAAGITPERFNSMILIVPNSHSFDGSPGTHAMRAMGLDPATATLEQLESLTYAPTTSDEVREAINAWDKQFADYPSFPVEDTIAAYNAISNFDNRENFKKLKLPTLVLSGQYDKVNTPEAGREIAESIDGGRFVQISDSSHNLFREKNDECIKYMIDFLRSVR